MMWWAIWCAAAFCSAAAAPATDAVGPPLDLSQIDPPAPDDEIITYGVHPLSSRFEGGAPWYYLLSDIPRESQVYGTARMRRGFSVNPAVDQLQRSAFSAQIERMANKNRHFLNSVGKRDQYSSEE